MTNYQKSNTEISLLALMDEMIEADNMGLSYKHYKAIQEETKAVLIIESHAKSCIMFWSNEGLRPMEILVKVKADLMQITGNPFEPNGGDEDLKHYFTGARDSLIKDFYTKYGI